MTPKAGAIAVALAAVIVAFIALGGGGEEAIIQGRLEDLVERIEKDGPKSPLQLAGDASKAATYFTADCSAEGIPGAGGFRGRDGVKQVVAGVSTQANSLGISLGENSVVLASSGTSATQNVTATVKVDRNGETTRDRLKATLDWVKVDGDWLISRVVLQR